MRTLDSSPVPDRSEAAGGRTVSAKPFFTATQALRRLWDVSEHPLFRRWSAGTFTDTELATYAVQHQHAVATLATLMRQAAMQTTGSVRHELLTRAREERAHAKLWGVLGTSLAEPVRSSPTAETRRCCSVWIGADADPLARRLAVMFALVSTRARLSRDDMALPTHAPTLSGAITQSFPPRDQECAARLHAILETLLPDADVGYLTDEVAHALEAQWDLLGGVQRALPPA